MPYQYKTLVLDTNALINLPPSQIAALSASSYATIPEVIVEIRDRQSKQGVLDSQFQYDLVSRLPSDEAVAAVTAFSKKTGDYPALSRTDLRLIALTWMLEKEENGDKYIRTDPKPVRTNQPGIKKLEQPSPVDKETAKESQSPPASANEFDDNHSSHEHAIESKAHAACEVPQSPDLVQAEPHDESPRTKTNQEDDDEGWITPSNIHKYKHRQHVKTSGPKKEVKEIAVACMTSDFAMQNVMMQMNLRVISGDGRMIRAVKTHVLRCHACFKITKDMDKKFCPSCGNPSLIRTSVGVDAQGHVTVYLKRGFQYNNRGTVYSIPALKGGRWEQGLVLREDQREYTQAVKAQAKREKQQKQADALSLDSILDGSFAKRGHHDVIIGTGRRNVNEGRRARR
ncbi:hypothetical protein SeMB42_g07522 [Synchytrium endobioticum]|uniref:20S-pre-rRNA D-site endonuclease NOB1 n=1 Tax=Synchytrium endobioticum TaxID=286115 RepID=A0A507BUJ2_9FUNG|nr:hypothetical protein SeMB42_g07522 [Synchytrium endobioticum]TPX40028.1 hypothetical protein SeLEV6574_g06844 [Synchytrium endobioticum]